MIDDDDKLDSGNERVVVFFLFDLIIWGFFGE